jgi:hypothetical protein
MPYSKEELQAARQKAHKAFDRFWTHAPYFIRKRQRTKCYEWLARKTGMTREECHFRYFDVGMCEAVIELCRMAEAGIIEPPKRIKVKKVKKRNPKGRFCN